MNKDRRILLIVLAGLVAVLLTKGTIWFFENHEYKDVEHFEGYSTKARKNKFLAAEYYLNELGVNAKSDGTRAKFLESHGSNETILLSNYGPNLSPTRYAALKSWLHDGGHLILSAQNYTFSNEEENNQLLQEFGIRAHANTDKIENSTQDNEQASVYTLSNGIDIEAKFRLGYYLEDKNKRAHFSLQDQVGIRLLQIKIGKGLLTVLSESHIFNNYRIGHNDHAYLLWWLTLHNKSPNSEVWLMFNVNPESIFTLLWKHAYEACVAFILLVIFSLLAMQNRIGPILPKVNMNSRNIIEHLSAIARYSWRQDYGVRLLKESRLLCEQALTNKYPVLKQLSQKERLDRLSRILDIPQNTLQIALYNDTKSTHEFIQSSYQLQKLWTK